jgi:Helix-turn-helix domain
MGEEKRAFKGVWICAAIFLDEKLTPAEKILLAEIDSLTTDDHGCYASNAHFAKRLGVTASRTNHIVARLTREGYIVRVCYDGRISHRVVSPEYSSNPATSRRLIERHRRLAKNSSSELSRMENSNSELLKIATVTSQKEQSRTAKNGGALLLEKVPTENTNRKTTTTNPDLDNENGNRKKPAEALGDQLAAEVAEEFGLSSNQRQRVTEFFESHGQGYVRSKAEIVRSEPRKNAAGALLAALRDDWQPPVPVSPAVDTEVEHLASSDDLARRMAWQW